MIGTCGVMPTAVITESSEKTMSITMIWSDDGQPARAGLAAAGGPCSSPSSLSWIS